MVNGIAVFLLAAGGVDLAVSIAGISVGACGDSNVAPGAGNRSPVSLAMLLAVTLRSLLALRMISPLVEILLPMAVEDCSLRHDLRPVA